MNKNNKADNDISVYIEDQEYIANTYVKRCFSVTILVYTLVFLLNLARIFIVDQSLMYKGYIPSILIYFVMLIVLTLVMKYSYLYPIL